MSWKKYNLFKKSGQEGYIDFLGYGKIDYSINSISNHNIHEIYYVATKKHVCLYNIIEAKKDKLEELFDLKLFYMSRFTSNKYIPIDNIILNLHITFVSKIEQNTEINLKISSKEELQNYNIWIDNENSLLLQKPLFNEIKKGNEYYLKNFGTCKVIKLYEYPNYNNLICDVEVIDGNIHNVDNKLKVMHIYDLYELPYKAIYRKWSFVLNDNLNEVFLAPHLQYNDYRYTLYWQEINEAAIYIVSLYILNNNVGEKKVYHLNDFEIQRGQKYYSISNLVGTNYIFKIRAEDRNGKIISKSRGLDYKGNPTWINEE